MRVLLTGADGFLGWHTRCRLEALTDHVVTVATRSNWQDLVSLVGEVDAVVHVAGVNRGGQSAVSDGNANLARDIVAAITATGVRVRLIYANSVQAGNETPYGDGKAAASSILKDVAQQFDLPYVDVLLPNLFGEHGQPQYNSFTATFIACRLAGDAPVIHDRNIELMHVQDAAQVLIEGLSRDGVCSIRPRGHRTSVQEVWEKVCLFSDLYSVGDMPPFRTKFDLDLFNTYRTAAFVNQGPIPLKPKDDRRGRLVETIRSHGGPGQAFVSTTRPGVSRGDHFHLSKIERFVVLEGEARIALRRMFSEDVVEFHVDGEHPVAIDMPTMWTHSLTNSGDGVLMTQFWTNELYDPENSDTFWVKVDSEECSR